MNSNKSPPNNGNKFQKLLDLLPVMVFESDKDFRITYANSFGLKQFGYTQDDIDKGLYSHQFVVPEEFNKLKANIREITKGNTLVPHEYKFKRKNGNTFWGIVNNQTLPVHFTKMTLHA